MTRKAGTNKDAPHNGGASGSGREASTVAVVYSDTNTMNSNFAETDASDRLIVYVDGFNLYHGMKKAAGHELLWLDVVKLAKLLRPRSQLVQVKYFTAMVLDESDAQSRQDRYLQAMAAAHPGALTIVKGRYMRKPKRCRECGATWTSYEEKQTDVNIAVHLVADAAAARADTFLIVSGDTDVIPAIKMARTLHKNATILAHFPPGRTSHALARMLPASRELTVAKLRQALLPEVVEAKNGSRFSRPEKWSSRGDSPEKTEAPGEETGTEHECAPTPAARTPSPADVARRFGRAV